MTPEYARELLERQRERSRRYQAKLREVARSDGADVSHAEAMAHARKVADAHERIESIYPPRGTIEGATPESIKIAGAVESGIKHSTPETLATLLTYGITEEAITAIRAKWREDMSEAPWMSYLVYQ
jgi:hypothetical protein